MINEQREFWSKVGNNYDRVVDLQIGGQTRRMVRQRLDREAGSIPLKLNPGTPSMSVGVLTPCQ